MSETPRRHKPLTLATVCAQQARIGTVLAAGLSLPFFRDGHAGRLQLQLANTRGLAETPSSSPRYRWRGDIGDFALSEPFPVLSLLSDCPLLPVTEEDDAAQTWYWTLYNQSMNPVLRTLVGEIHPLEHDSVNQCGDKTATCAWLCVSWNGITVRSRMQAADAVWLALFSRADWRRDRRALPTGMGITIPLTLADVVLPLPTLQRLRAGDLILPNRPWFTPSGEGTLSSGTLRLRGTLQLAESPPYTFTVTDMETVPMPSSTTDMMRTDPHSDASALELPVMSDNVTGNIPPLPVTLHIRCGSLVMTLAELQHLASGSILTLRDVVPGHAWLYHGDIALASGELVDVEGRLGLQITQRFSATEDAAFPAQEQDMAQELAP